MQLLIANETKIFSRKHNILWKMASYEDARIKETNLQLSKLNSAAKSKTKKTSGITKKNFQDEELPHISNNKINN